MAWCNKKDPSGSGWICQSNPGHRGRHPYRPVGTGLYIPEEMKRVTEPVKVGNIEGGEIDLPKDPLPGRGGPLEPKEPPEPDPMMPDLPAAYEAVTREPWTPDGGDFVSLKGKAYLPARRRIQWMRGIPESHPDWTIDTEIIEHERGTLAAAGPVGVAKVSGGFVIVRANVFDADGRLISTGIKSEYSENFSDYLEKAETGAIARALAVAGYGTESALDLDEGVAEGRISDSPVEVSGRGSPVLSHSGASPVGRGGTSTTPTRAQIARVAQLAKESGLGHAGLAVVMDNTFPAPIGELPVGDGLADKAIAAHLLRQSGADVGKLIGNLEAAVPATDPEIS